jgi:hypothetical protein
MSRKEAGAQIKYQLPAKEQYQAVGLLCREKPVIHIIQQTMTLSDLIMTVIRYCVIKS